MDFSGQRVLVTGASRGIGEAIASRFATLGAFVVGTATTEAGARDFAARRYVEGVSAIGRVLDVSVPESIHSFFSDENFSEGFDIIVNNAGITRDGLSLRMPAQDWDRVLAVNVSGAFRVAQAGMRRMMQKRSGRIINISSVVARQGNAGQAAYCAAKAGLEGLTRALALELAPRGITVNAVAPGFIDTDMTQALSEEQKNNILSRIPLKRMGLASEIAGTVTFLASPEASYITGQVIAVNGGLCFT